MTFIGRKSPVPPFQPRNKRQLARSQVAPEIPLRRLLYLTQSSTETGVPSLNPKGMVNWHPVTEAFGTQTGRSMNSHWSVFWERCLFFWGEPSETLQIKSQWKGYFHLKRPPDFVCWTQPPQFFFWGEECGGGWATMQAYAYTNHSSFSKWVHWKG